MTEGSIIYIIFWKSPQGNVEFPSRYKTFSLYRTSDSSFDCIRLAFSGLWRGEWRDNTKPEAPTCFVWRHRKYEKEKAVSLEDFFVQNTMPNKNPWSFVATVKCCPNEKATWRERDAALQPALNKKPLDLIYEKETEMSVNVNKTGSKCKYFTDS